MTLTIGTGPFGSRSRGTFNFDRNGVDHVLYFEDCPWRVRCQLEGEIIADSRRVKLLHESGNLPVYYFPQTDVQFDRFVPSPFAHLCEYKGKASFWSLVVDHRLVRDAAWAYRDGFSGAPSIGDYVAFRWDAMDRWFEEDSEAFAHARDPYHRVDVMPTSRQLVVTLDGVVLAASNRAVVLFETGLPPRYYLPIEDARLQLLRASDTETQCAYKGTTGRYWSRGEHRDIAWAYDRPRPEVAAITGRICFYDERVHVHAT